MHTQASPSRSSAGQDLVLARFEKETNNDRDPRTVKQSTAGTPEPGPPAREEIVGRGARHSGTGSTKPRAIGGIGLASN